MKTQRDPSAHADAAHVARAGAAHVASAAHVARASRLDFARGDRNRSVVVHLIRRCVVRRGPLASRAALVSQRSSRTLFVASMQRTCRQMTDLSTDNQRISRNPGWCVGDTPST